MTWAEVNSAPRVGPIVISEIHYNPSIFSPVTLRIYPKLLEGDLEFEVHNPTEADVDLTDWRIRGNVD